MNDQMTPRRWAVFAALCGLLYPLLLFLGDDVIGAAAGEAPGRDTSVAEAVEWATESDTARFYIGRLIGGGLALIALVVFVTHLATRIRRWDDGWLPGAAFGAGVVAAGLQMAAVIPHYTAARWAEELDPEVVAAISIDLAGIWGLAFLPMAAFIAIASLAAVRGALFARWAGWLGLVLAPWLALGELVHVASSSEQGLAFIPVILAWVIWFPAAAISTALRERASGPVAAPSGRLAANRR